MLRLAPHARKRVGGRAASPTTGGSRGAIFWLFDRTFLVTYGQMYGLACLWRPAGDPFSGRPMSSRTSLLARPLPYRTPVRCSARAPSTAPASQERPTGQHRCSAWTGEGWVAPCPLVRLALGGVFVGVRVTRRCRRRGVRRQTKGLSQPEMGCRHRLVEPLIDLEEIP